MPDSVFLAASDKLEGLADCPDCTPFRGEPTSWLAAVQECPRCSRVLEGFEPESWSVRDDEQGELLERLEHFDPSLLGELDEAPARLAELLRGSFEEQRARAERSRHLHHWGLVQALLAESVLLRNRRPRISHARAQLAVVIAENLDPDRYHPAWVADLNAKALALLARAERRLGRFREAERSMIRAGVWAVRGTNGGRARGFLDDLSVTQRLERRGEEPGGTAAKSADEHDKIARCSPPSPRRPRRPPEA
ncbi:MAG: hypothetical protein SF066_03130 [Thermoanaerobaculia bacterium]|nr:hypothetical protein [Thermoanaerobaculia bacterium]